MSSTSSIPLQFPDISDDNLIFDEDETRQILKFFFASRASRIDAVTVTNVHRRFAQQMLVVGVDASYAIGYLEILVNVLTRQKPGKGIKVLVKKLTKKYVKHWWKHATQNNLYDAQIYDTVRAALAYGHISDLDYILDTGLAKGELKGGFNLIVANRCDLAWV